ncbi:MAG: helix-turn-helix transcriptional regulator [Chitinophagaceae bacterium]|nr:helix-turn-helix transcriptional regulator [Chitinophagaceae bacterium]
MKPFVEKLALSENTSFVARTYRTPHFEVPWHQHIEYEMILLTEGEGVAMVGNHIGEFKVGDIFFIGANLPHCFKKAHKDLVTSAVVVQFNEKFWGERFLELPECSSIRRVLNESAKGIKPSESCRKILEPIIKLLEHAAGISRITRLCECLDLLAADNYDLISTQPIRAYNNNQKARIDAIFDFTFKNFKEEIAIDKLARIAGMSVPAFCTYFKKSTKKTYIGFLNELRIGNACKLLVESQESVSDICFESGYNTLANFNKQFLKLKHTTPSSFRKNFRAEQLQTTADLPTTLTRTLHR